MVLADRSSGLPGGSFLLATNLNRKDVKIKKEKQAVVEAFREFFLLLKDPHYSNTSIKGLKTEEKNLQDHLDLDAEIQVEIDEGFNRDLSAELVGYK